MDYQTSRERQTQREDLFRFLKADEVFFDLQILTSAPLGGFATRFVRTRRERDRESETQRKQLFKFVKADEVFFVLQILTSAPLGDFATSFARTSGAATTAAAGRGTHWREEERAALLTVSPLHSGPSGQQHLRASLPYWTE